MALCFGLGFTWTFLGKQNERAKVRSDVLYVRFLVNKGIQKLPKSDTLLLLYIKSLVNVTFGSGKKLC